MYESIIEERSATESCSQTSTEFGFSLQQAFLNSLKQIFMTAICIYTTNWMWKKQNVNEYFTIIEGDFTKFTKFDLCLTE
jgi:hypothetical protein